MINVNELKKGIVIEYDNQLVQIMDFQHVLQNKVAYVRVKMKNLRTGSITETALKGSEQKFKDCFIDHLDMQYLYSSNDSYTFMNMETYDQLDIPLSHIEWEKNFLTEGIIVKVMSYQGEILTIELPDKVTLKVVQAPDIKGDSSSKKKAILETGLEINVPGFIFSKDLVIVDTITGNYVSRA